MITTVASLGHRRDVIPSPLSGCRSLLQNRVLTGSDRCLAANQMPTLQRTLFRGDASDPRFELTRSGRPIDRYGRWGVKRSAFPLAQVARLPSARSSRGHRLVLISGAVAVAKRGVPLRTFRRANTVMLVLGCHHVAVFWPRTGPKATPKPTTSKWENGREVSSLSGFR
jgi:hypothetical protein